MQITETQSNVVLKGGVALFMAEYVDILIQLRWMLFLALVLILADLWFGCKASLKQKIPLRKSRAGRRTANKIVDYFVYILLGTSLGMAVAEPYGMDPKIFSISIILLCYTFEIDSICSHICVLHNVKSKISIWSIIKSLLTKKAPNLDLEENSKDQR